MTWQQKAHALVAQMCTASWAHMNLKGDGTPYHRHRAYSVPALAEELVRCLGADDEEGAKAVFLQLAGDAYPQVYRT